MTTNTTRSIIRIITGLAVRTIIIIRHKLEISVASLLPSADYNTVILNSTRILVRFFFFYFILIRTRPSAVRNSVRARGTGNGRRV